MICHLHDPFFMMFSPALLISHPIILFPPTPIPSPLGGAVLLHSQALHDEVRSREAEMNRLEALGAALGPLSCRVDRDWLAERVGAARGGHGELLERCARRAALLEQALANARLFGEEEVEVLNWLAEVAQRLAEVEVQGYQPEQLGELHKYALVRGVRMCKHACMCEMRQGVYMRPTAGSALFTWATGGRSEWAALGGDIERIYPAGMCVP